MTFTSYRKMCGLLVDNGMDAAYVCVYTTINNTAQRQNKYTILLIAGGEYDPPSPSGV